jgi:uncharacterized protein (TIGR00251 family)
VACGRGRGDAAERAAPVISRAACPVCVANNMALLNIRVQPRALRNKFMALSEEGALKVRVTAAPTGGKANDAVLKLLAKSFGVATGALTIVRGDTSRNKVIKVEGLSEAEIRQPFQAPQPTRRGRTQRSLLSGRASPPEESPSAAAQ